MTNLCIRWKKVKIMHLSMLSRRGGGQGMGWGFDCLCWPWGRAFDEPVLPGEGIFESFFARRRDI